LFFAAAIRLRYSHPNVDRRYRIPGGNLVMALICGVGILTCLVVFVLGYFPPSQIDVGSKTGYELILIAGTIVICIPPFLMKKK